MLEFELVFSNLRN